MKSTKTSKALLDLLNKAIARELQVSIQYMWQHVLSKKCAAKDELKKIAITEMKHAEVIAERLAYLGGTPTTKPDPIFVGETLKEMLEKNKKDEEGAIALYKKTVAAAGKAGDETTQKLFRQILADEEEHRDTFAGLLEEIQN